MNRSTSPRSSPLSRVIRQTFSLHVLAAVSFFAFFAGPALASPTIPSKKFSPPSAVNLTYDVDFLWFKNMARGLVRLRMISKNRYRAELLAETEGLIGLLTSYQKNHFISEMEFLPEQGRLLSRKFTKITTRGEFERKSIAFIDYKNHEVRWVTFQNGEFKREGGFPFPDGTVYEDVLSAFFNFRSGAFGDLRPGRQFTVTSLPDYEIPENGEYFDGTELARSIETTIADEKVEKEYRRRYNRTKNTGMLVFVKVPKEIFGQETGEIRIWFDPNLIPVSATVEDAILFGDVHGSLRSADIHP